VILVIAEWQGDAPTRATYEVLAAAQACAAGAPIQIVVPGAAAVGPAQALAALGVGDVILLDDPALDTYTADGYVAALLAYVTPRAPQLVLCAHSYQARDFAPRLAARLGVPVVTDVIHVEGPPPAR
jgi:electron transfer flavoprotein alpha subunit